MTGESRSADLGAIEPELPVLRTRIDQYHPSDVFSMDETDLFPI